MATFAQKQATTGNIKTTTPSDSSKRDSVVAKPVGDIKTTVTYNAKDSMRFDIDSKEVFLYGDADIDYGDISLNADRVEINWETNTVKAQGTPDTLGKEKGTPVFKQGKDQYVAKIIKYNFKTKKGHISEIITQQGEGYLHGETVKKDENNNMFVLHAQYTTCNLSHPHFYISANKIKMMPKDKLISGPFNLVIGDVPTPLGFILGLFPIPETHSSGIIIPTYGESRERGFFLRGGGYYWDINEYIGMKFLGEAYSKGGYGFSIMSDYKKRYSFDGNFSMRYNRREFGDEGNKSIIKDFWVDWTHRPQTRKSGTFSAQVNAGTSSYNRNNSFNVNNVLTSNFSSRVSYTKTFTGTPFSLGINAAQQQNVSTNSMNLDLPEISFNMMSIYPLRRSGSSGTQTWYDNLNVSYSMSGKNSISNMPVAQLSIPLNADTSAFIFRETLKINNLSGLFDRMRNGVQHRIPISTTFRMLKNINVSPSLNYDEKWYFKRLNYSTVNTGKGKMLDSIRVDTINGFSRVYNYSAAISFNTRMYGTFYTRKSKKVEAIRHTINPAISLGFQPDFSEKRFGMYQRVVANNREYLLNPYQSSIYGGASTGRSASVSFGVVNSLEMKLRPKVDTAAKAGSPAPKGEKVRLLDNFSISSGYNLIADSFKLAPVSIGLQTNIVNRFAINVRATLDPYVYQRDTSPTANSASTGLRKDRYAWNEKGKGLGQFSNISANLTTSLNPDALKPKTLTKAKLDPAMQSQLDFINANRDMYVDFSVPWNASINYAFSFSKTGYARSSIQQGITISGDISLTPKWKLTTNTSYDIKAKTLVLPTIGIYRDLHCWQMNFSWTPIGSGGRGGTYSIDINTKSSILQDLKFSRRRSFYDR